MPSKNEQSFRPWRPFAVLALCIVTLATTIGAARAAVCDPFERIIDAKADQMRRRGVDPGRVIHATHSVGSHCLRRFQGMEIYVDRATRVAHEVHGVIRTRYRAVGAHRSDLGYPQTDELTMTGSARSRYSLFEGGVIPWHPEASAWVDRIGEDNSGRISGSIRMCDHLDFGGRCTRVPVGSTEPLIDADRIASRGLEGRISSFSLSGIPATASVYAYHGGTFDGAYIRMSGGRGEPGFNFVGGRNNDRISSFQVVNHGTASLRLDAGDIRGELPGDFWAAIPDVNQRAAPNIDIDPRTRTVRITAYGVVPLRLRRDKHVDIWADYRVRLLEGDRVSVEYIRGGYDVSRCGLSFVACRRIRDRLQAEVSGGQRFRDIGRDIASRLNDKLAQLTGAADDFCRGETGLRRVNLLPGAVELVISESAPAAECLDTLRRFDRGLDAVLSTHRPAVDWDEGET